MTDPGRLVSIIVPVFNEAENIAALVERFDAFRAANPTYRFELVVTDDGSTDDTAALTSAAAAKRADIVLVALSRNFGSHYAITAALDHASGDAVIAIGGDLQEPVEVIGEFLARWEDGFDIVWGIRDERVDQGLAGRAFSHAFSKLFTSFSDAESYPAEGPSGFLASRAVVDVVRTLPEANRNLLALIAWTGFDQTRVVYQQEARRNGRSKWTTSRKVKLAIDSFVEFSHAPVRFMTYVGLAIALLGFVYSAFISIRRLIWVDPIEGWTTVMVAVLIIGGLQLTMLGVLGEYIWRTAEDARRRPLYVVKQVDDAAAARRNVAPIRAVVPDHPSEAANDG